MLNATRLEIRNPEFGYPSDNSTVTQTRAKWQPIAIGSPATDEIIQLKAKGMVVQGGQPTLIKRSLPVQITGLHRNLVQQASVFNLS